MADIIRQLAVKSSTSASTPTTYDIGSTASAVTYTPSETAQELIPGQSTDVNNALNYLSTHMGGAGLVVVEFNDVSSLPAVKTNVTGVDVETILLAFELSNPSAQTAVWNVTTETGGSGSTGGTVTISSASGTGISGTTNVKLVFGKNKGAVIDDDTTVSNILGDFANIETSPATYAHNKGDFIVWNQKLYKVTSNISAGASLQVGTNIALTDVGSQISLINSNKINLIYKNFNWENLHSFSSSGNHIYIAIIEGQGYTIIRQYQDNAVSFTTLSGVTVFFDSPHIRISLTLARGCIVIGI